LHMRDSSFDTHIACHTLRRPGAPDPRHTLHTRFLQSPCGRANDTPSRRYRPQLHTSRRFTFHALLPYRMGNPVHVHVAATDHHIAHDRTALLTLPVLHDRLYCLHATVLLRPLPAPTEPARGMGREWAVPMLPQPPVLLPPPLPPQPQRLAPPRAPALMPPPSVPTPCPCRPGIR